jgi:hypothetical protein
VRKVLRHMQQNAVAYLALFVALGGTGYAAVNLPAGSVGGTQLKNRSIQPVKFDPRFINGTVRAWAEVNANGTVQSSSSRASVKLGKGAQGPGFYLVFWKRAAAPSKRGCFSIAGINGFGGAGSTQTSVGVTNPHTWDVFVHTYRPNGQFAAQPFYVAVLC